MEILASCPCCLADKDKIVYQESHNRIYCSECGLIYNENDAHKNGFKNLIDYWNHIGIYFPME